VVFVATQPYLLHPFLVVNPSPIAAVVFDLDGLMFNTELLYDIVMKELLARRRIERFDAELKRLMMGQPGPAAFKAMFDYHQLTHETYESIQGESDEIFKGVLEEKLEPMPGLFNLLDALETAKLPKAIATSSRLQFVEYVLGRFDLQKRFGFILTAESITHGKPNPEIYSKAAARHGFEPAQVLALEDSHNGCKAAVNAGLFAVAVPGEHSRDHDFTGARFVANGLSDPRIYEALSIAAP
jgi:HAD superfamily hydrolase (TIGR01509 family)